MCIRDRYYNTYLDTDPTTMDPVKGNDTYSMGILRNIMEPLTRMEAVSYTHLRLSKISMELTADINKDTVDFMPNFDETEKEPVVLPARFPNLLVNGTSGIAVGMACLLYTSHYR